MAARAGLRVNALKADKATETAMVTANCWYNRPVMPGMNAVGMPRWKKIVGSTPASHLNSPTRAECPTSIADEMGATVRSIAGSIMTNCREVSNIP
jgi:hypothetical protein